MEEKRVEKEKKKETPNCPQCKTNGLVVPYKIGRSWLDDIEDDDEDAIEYSGSGKPSYSIKSINCTKQKPFGKIVRFVPKWYCRYCNSKFD